MLASLFVVSSCMSLRVVVPSSMLRVVSGMIETRCHVSKFGHRMCITQSWSGAASHVSKLGQIMCFTQSWWGAAVLGGGRRLFDWLVGWSTACAAHSFQEWFKVRLVFSTFQPTTPSPLRQSNALCVCRRAARIEVV